jgi:hypothetical protein
LAKLLDDCSSELAAKAPPTGWSIVQVVCHMRDNEERALERMRLMRDSSDPYVESYDQEQWAAERGYASVDFRQALIAYERFRIAHSCELAALSAGEWDLTGRHAERVITSIRIQTMRLLCHDSVHAAQIARLLDELARQ